MSQSKPELTPLAQKLLRTQQDLAFAAGKMRTELPRGAGIARIDRLNTEVESDPVEIAPSGWRPAPGMARTKTGPGPSRYDPRKASTLIKSFMSAYQDEMREAMVMVKWAEAVGDQVAAHTEIVSIEGDRIVVQASSTSWATALQMQLGSVLRRLDEECGRGTVKTVIVRGPSAGRSWKHGPRTVRGRGVRDTYG